jgi:2-polyprenyl-3-methyl-5-hydroxy-6-metoxy-1,4-benzoquinol methylase
MDSYQETFNTWNKVAKLYEEKFMGLNLYDDTYVVFCEQISKINPSVLEIGCGPGNITKYILSKRPDFNIHAIDIAPNMIQLAKINNPTASFEVMDSRKIGQIKTTFDGIICGFCVPYLSKEDCNQLIKDFSHLLSDNGIVYISFVEGEYDKSGYLAGSTGDRTYFYYHELIEITKTLKEHGFEILHTIRKNYPKNTGPEEIHTIVIAKKI